MTPEIDIIKQARQTLQNMYDSWGSEVPQDFVLAGIKVLDKWTQELEEPTPQPAFLSLYPKSSMATLRATESVVVEEPMSCSVEL